jgi:Fe-S cluster biogenesis protein NfuA
MRAAEEVAEDTGRAQPDPEDTGRAQPDPEQVVAHLEELLGSLEAEAGAGVTQRVEEVVRLLVTLYGEALGHVLEAVREAGEPGREVLRRLTDDPLVSGLLVVHDLHPDDLATRVSEALETVRPYLGSHAGDVELLEVTAGDVVRLRLSGTCDGCPASSVTLTTTVETAIRERAPEVADIVVDGLEPDAATLGLAADTASPAGAPQGGTYEGLPLLQIQRRPADDVPLGPHETAAAPRPRPGDGSKAGPAGGAWVALRDGSEGGPVAGQVRTLHADGAALAVTRLGDDVVAYRDACAGCGASLAGAGVTDAVAACPSCGRRYDLRHAGRAEDGGPPLHPVPLLAAADPTSPPGPHGGDGDVAGLRVPAAALTGGVR